MKKSKKIVSSAVDEFYNEDSYELDEKIKSSEEYIDFKEKLSMSMEKLDSLTDDDMDFDINTLEIIERAGEVQGKRKSLRELIAFVSVSFGILLVYASLGFKFGIKFLVISQVITEVAAPWIIIPLALKSRGSEVK